jgi:type II secretory pathway pseudopilin PulG
MRGIKLVIAAIAALGVLAVPGVAMAKSRDRDHDRMADKWEKRHHLNTHANDARKDPDHDGLSNLSEFRHHTNPQKADSDNDGIDDQDELNDDTNPNNDDSDNDGIEDRDEISGTVASFTNGVLTIQLAADGAGQVSGMVTDATVIECDDEDAQQPTASASDDGSGDDNSGPGPGGDDNSGPGSSSDDQGGDDQGDDDNQGQCTAGNLTAGARVHEAELAEGSNVFKKIELVPSA